MPCQAQTRRFIVLDGVYIQKVWALLHSLIPHPGLALPLSSGQAMRTPTPEYDNISHTDTKATMPQAMTILNAAFTIAFFDERSKS